MKIALVTCAGEKLAYAAPAKDLYISDLFKKASSYAVDNYEAWHILSAEHGLVDPDEVLEPYNKTLTDKQQFPAAELRTWSEKVATQIKGKYRPGTEIDVHAGNEYRKYLVPLLHEVGYQVRNAWEGLKGIGYQKSWYKRMGY